MKYIEVRGGSPLEGSLHVQGAKNSALPILAAVLLHPGLTRLRGCPRLRDVDAALDILGHLGCICRWEGDDLLVDASHVSRWDIPDDLSKRMRSSVFFLGPLLARMGRAEMGCPGGCALGPRPIDVHLAALRRLGAEIREEDGILCCEAEKIHGTEICLRLPSVGATENAILAALGGEEETTIRNAAREPEIEDLQKFLISLGFCVKGAGTDTVSVAGKGPTHDTVHTIMPDRIAAATYLAAAAGAGGSVELTHVCHRHIAAVTAVLRRGGCTIWEEPERVILERKSPLLGGGVVSTEPYPGFPTDAQAPLMAAFLRGTRPTVFVENIFEERFRHVEGLRALGGDILLEGRIALVRPVDRLRGSTAEATDLRGGAALLVAGLQAEDTTTVGSIQHIYRGYEDPVRDLKALGADIRLADHERK